MAGSLTQRNLRIIGAVVIAGFTAGFIFYYQGEQAYQQDKAAITQQTEAIDRLQAENQRLATVLAGSTASGDPLSDLPRLRAEVALLRSQTNQLSTLTEENRRL